MEWWKKAVVYQIYPRSFKDSNGDGVGDIPGILSKLDYLEELGIDLIWLSPVFQSPQDDNGYDISDYRDIDPMFGTLDDMKELIAKAGEHHIGIMLDMVLNHSSDEHRWFVESRKSRTNPYRDYYIWRDGTIAADGTRVPPNGLTSGFGGSAWQYDERTEQYYLHFFSVKQPDLNWENPKVRRELYEVLNFWMDLGVAGFRFDVLELFGKEPDRMIGANGPKLHEYIREMNRESFGGHEMATVGECWNADVPEARKYSNPDGSELSMIFQFQHIMADAKDGNKWDILPFDLVKIKKIFEKWQTGLSGTGWNSLFWDNHDLPRIVSRWGDDGEYRVQAAKMFATVLHGMQGTPFIYEGEELGMTSTDYDISEYRDIELLNMYREYREKGVPEEKIMESIHARGRDNARTPMQWDDSEGAGFTEPGVTPWLKINPNFRQINAASQIHDPDSVFSYYKKLIALRKKQDILTDGNFRLMYPEDPEIFAYGRENERQKLTVIANFRGGEPAFDIAPYLGEKTEVLIHNYKDRPEGRLRPYEALMILEEKN